MKLERNYEERTFARTTIRPNSQLYRKKNDLEVFSFIAWIYVVTIQCSFFYMHPELTTYPDMVQIDSNGGHYQST